MGMVGTLLAAPVGMLFQHSKPIEPHFIPRIMPANQGIIGWLGLQSKGR